jgi:glycosyltransferase involved in cell wall biosynthesis
MSVGTHDTHHLFERLSLKDNEIRVIDFEIRWRSSKRPNYWSRRTVTTNIARLYPGARITHIRPSMIRLPIFDYLSIIVTHRREIAQQIKDFRPDIIVGLGIINASVARKLAYKNNIPFIYYLLDEVHLLIPQTFLQGIGRVLESENIRNAETVLVTNSAMKEYAIDMGSAPEKTEIIRHGVNLDRFRSADGTRIREELHFSDDDVVLLFMGWLYTFSGMKEVAEGLSKQPNPNIKLLLIGKGELLDDLKQIASTNERVVVVDWVDHDKIPEYVAASDICLLPCRDVEVMKRIIPIKMIEYLACGKPVIASSMEGLVKEFGNDSGVFFINDPSQVFSKTEEILKPSNMERSKEDALRYSSSCDWSLIYEDFEGLLTNSMTKRKNSS